MDERDKDLTELSVITCVRKVISDRGNWISVSSYNDHKLKSIEEVIELLKEADV